MNLSITIAYLFVPSSLSAQKFLHMSIFRKPTSIRSYTRWGSFCPPRHKINLIKTLVHRALVFCSKTKLVDELDFIKKTLLKNRYPEDVITNKIKYTCLKFSTKPKFRQKRYPVYLKLPYIGNASLQRLQQINRSVDHCFNSIKLRVVLKSNVLFSPNLKDRVTAFQKHSLFYRFTCKCDICYIGRPNQLFEIRINKHIPSSIPTHVSNYTTKPSSYNSTSPLTANFWPIRPAHAYSVPLCLPSRRHQQMNSNYPFWKHTYKKYKTELCIPKQSYTPLLLILFSDQQKKTSLTVPTVLAYNNFFPICFFLRPSWIFLWLEPHAYFL